MQLLKFKIMKSPLCDELLIPSSAQFKDLYSLYIVKCVLNAFLTGITAIILNSITIHAIQKTSSKLDELLMILRKCYEGPTILVPGLHGALC